MKRTGISLAAAVLLVLAPSAYAASTLKIVTTLSTFADLAKTIGGSHVEAYSVASAKFNPHFIEPKPSDVLKLKKADLFIHAGLDLEAWRPALVEAAGNPKISTGGSAQLDLSRGYGDSGAIALLEVPDRTVSRSEGDIHLFGNPHYWMAPENGRTIAREIAAKLCEIDAGNAADYRKNLADFEAALDKKVPEWKEAIKPYAGAEVIGYHNEWPYLMEFLGLKLDKFLEPKPGIPPTPKQTDYLEQYMKSNDLKVVIQAVFFPTKAAQALVERVDGKTVLLSQAVGDAPEAKDYISMIDYDVQALVDALKQP